MPDGRKKKVTIDLDDRIAYKADMFIARGGSFECEVLTTGAVSFTAVMNEEDVAIQLSKNNQEVVGKVKQLINNAYNVCNIKELLV